MVIYIIREISREKEKGRIREGDVLLCYLFLI